jgi:hypothetical protein
VSTSASIGLPPRLLSTSSSMARLTVEIADQRWRTPSYRQAHPGRLKSRRHANIELLNSSPAFTATAVARFLTLAEKSS